MSTDSRSATASQPYGQLTLLMTDRSVLTSWAKWPTKLPIKDNLLTP
ncbi:MAG: hypothetical protein ACRDUV_03660 [Pseudonocardiaceae bacterium]